MNRAHDRPGAVILGGGFACLEAARNLDKCGVRVCVVGSATSVARFSRSVGRFVKWPRGLKDEELPDFLVAMAEKYGLIATGGTDFHGPRTGRDARLGVEDEDGAYAVLMERFERCS